MRRGQRMWRNAAKCGAFLAHFGPIRAILGCFEMRRNAAADPNAAHFGAFRRHARRSESLAPGPADALSADPAISAPWAPVYSCLTGGGASSVVGDAGCSRGASAPGPPAGSCAGMMPDSCLRALKRLVYPRRRRRRERVDGGGVL